MRNMSKDQQTALYRWIIGGMVAIIGYFVIDVHHMVKDANQYRIEQSSINRELFEFKKDQKELNKIFETDIRELQRNQSFIGTPRSTTNVN